MWISKTSFYSLWDTSTKTTTWTSKCVSFRFDVIVSICWKRLVEVNLTTYLFLFNDDFLSLQYLALQHSQNAWFLFRRKAFKENNFSRYSIFTKWWPFLSKALQICWYFFNIWSAVKVPSVGNLNDYATDEFVLIYFISEDLHFI